MSETIRTENERRVTEGKRIMAKKIDSIISNCLSKGMGKDRLVKELNKAIREVLI